MFDKLSLMIYYYVGNVRRYCTTVTYYSIIGQAAPRSGKHGARLFYLAWVVFIGHLHFGSWLKGYILGDGTLCR